MSTLSLSSPTMSDKTLLLSVEDLIGIAMGPREGNTVNFNVLRMILHILARQMRVLEQKVVVVAGELPAAAAGRGVGRKRAPSSARKRSIRPEFATEEEEIEWEREHDEMGRRIGSKGRDRRRSSGLRGEDDDGGKGGRGRSASRAGGAGKHGYEKGGRGGRAANRYDDRDDYEEGGRGRSAGGRGGRYDEDDRDGGGRRGRDKSKGGRGGHGGGIDEDDAGGLGRLRGRGGRDEYDEEGEGRGRARGAGGSGDDEDEEGGGRGRAGGIAGRRGGADDEAGGRRGGRGGQGREDDDEGGGRGRGGEAGEWSGSDGEGERTGGWGKAGGGSGGRDEADEDGGERGRVSGAGGSSDDDEAEEVGGRGGGGRGGRGGADEEGGGGRRAGGASGGRGGVEGSRLNVRVEKGPTTLGSERDRDSIAVVTQSQFALLEEQVEELMKKAGPLPALTMPDNSQLRQELAAGASLTDAMQAMQVSARVQAAEQAIGKLGGLLTQLAASGALPADAARAVMAGGWADEMQLKSTSSGTAYQSSRVDASQSTPGGQDTKSLGGGTRVGSKDSMAPGKFVTKSEMGSALQKLHDEITKALQAQIERAGAAADAAEKTAKSVSDKVEELMKMDARLNAMSSVVEDYAEQLNGFDAGLNTQMASFKEQMDTMRAELQTGMELLQAGNSNPETAAVLELNERFEGLVHGLDETLLQHSALSNMQSQLTTELKTLVEGVEMLREQKADRDELFDILRDKADVSMLEGLVRQEEFDKAQGDLEDKLAQCHDRFHKQDNVWMDAMKDMRELADSKAQLMELLKIRDEATIQLRGMDERINRLALIMGEPEAAVLMRRLARDAVCASCLTPALMRPGGAPQPPRLPAAHAAGAGAAHPPEPCPPQPHASAYPDFRTHKCHRWVGGSHTLLPPARAHAAPLHLPDVTRKYTGYGDDGRLYWLESAMEPCVECNPEAAGPAPPPTSARSDGAGGAGGAGDAGQQETCEC